METEGNRHAERTRASSGPPAVRAEAPLPAARDATVSSDTPRTGRTARAWPLAWLLSLFALTLIAPLLGFGMFAADQMIATERAAAEERVRRAALMLSTAIDRTLRGLTEMLQAFAGSGSLREGDFAGFHRDASAVLRGTGQAILLIGRDLNQLANTRVPYGTPLPQTGDPDTAQKVFATGKPANGDLVWGQLAQRFVITVMVPVIIDGEVPYALILSPEPATLNRILEEHHLPDGWVAGVSDGHGLNLARSARHQDFFGKPISAETAAKSSGRSGVITTKSLEGDVVLHAYFWSDVSGWRTAVWVPLAILEAPARQLRLTLAGLAAVAVAVSLLTGAFVGRRLARPIAGAARAAAALGRGVPVAYAPCAVAEVNVVGAALAAAASARIAAETALRGREALLRSATDNAAVGLVMLDGERRYTFANPAYAKILGLPHSAAELIGKGPADVLGAVYETQIAPRLDRAFAGERVTYELARPRAGAAANEKHHYVVVYDPHCNHEGRVVGVIVTIFDITERKQAEQALAESKQQLQFVADHAPVLIAQCDSQQRYKFVNQPYADFFGRRPADIVGLHPRDVLGEQAYAHAAPYIEAALSGHQTEYDLELPDTPRGPRAVRVAYAPELDASGRVAGLVAAITDITERKRSEDHVRLLLKELSHRTKNMMAVVQAISWQTAQQSVDFEDFEQRFMQRLEALARSHDLLVKRDWHGVVLEDLVRAQLEPFLDRAKERVAAHGPALLLAPMGAQDLGLALHELATNASKYGALSVPAGQIDIGWMIDGDATSGGQLFHMTWRESGGPTVSPPVHKGFGTIVMTSTLSRSFNGKTKLEYDPEGLSWEFAAPVGHLITELL